MTPLKVFFCIAVIVTAAFFIFTLTSDRVTNIATVIGSQQKLIYADCILTYSGLPLGSFVITGADINDDQIRDAFVRYSEGPECGSKGCIHEICISDAAHTFVHVPFGYAAHEISTLNTMSDGMKDLMLNNDKNLIMRWNGSQYVLND